MKWRACERCYGEGIVGGMKCIDGHDVEEWRGCPACEGRGAIAADEDDEEFFESRHSPGAPGFTRALELFLREGCSHVA